MYLGVAITLAVASTNLTALQDLSVRAVDARLEGKDCVKGLCRFVDYPGGARSDRFVLNPQFWLKGVDFSCVSPWNGEGGRFRAGTAISPRHIVFAGHFPLSNGTRIVFVGEDGGVCPCYVAGSKRIGKTDIMVGALNADLTPNIKPAKLLPPDCEKWLGNLSGFPVVTFDQNECVVLGKTGSISTDKLPKRMGGRKAGVERWEQFSHKLISGDSGNPAFLLFGDQPVLAYCLFGGGGGLGYVLHPLLREIQAAMDELCPGYALEVVSRAKCEDECEVRGAREVRSARCEVRGAKMSEECGAKCSSKSTLNQKKLKKDFRPNPQSLIPNPYFTQ